MGGKGRGERHGRQTRGGVRKGGAAAEAEAAAGAGTVPGVRWGMRLRPGKDASDASSTSKPPSKPRSL